MTVVFYYTLDYAKTTIFNTIATLLSNALNGQVPDPKILDVTAAQIDYVSMWVLIGTITFAIITSIAAAYITLKPTRQALALQKQFVSSVAHELRTPLSVMRTNNEVALYDIPANSPIREIIQANIDETIHLTKVLNNLLVFSRVDASETLPFSVVDINGTIETVIKKLQHLADRKNVHLTSSLEPNITAHGNQAAIEQALYNLVKNAITYSKYSEASIIIHTIAHKDTISIQVTDNGIGIGPNELPHIFSPFYRVHEARGSTESMGLGLALVYEVMKLHHGTISVQSELGKGTTFTLNFRRPFISKKETTDKAARPDTVEYNFKKTNI